VYKRQPDGEIHEIGLLYLNYELALRGFKTIYLGQSLPLDNLNYFFNADTEVRFITSITVKPYDEDLEDYFEKIDKVLEGTPHCLKAIGMRTKLVEGKSFNSNINVYPSVIEYLDRLKETIELEK